MKIIILDNFLNHYYHNVSKFFIRRIQSYREIKLKRLIKTLRKKYGTNIEIKIFSTNTKQYNLDKNIQVETAADARFNINIEKFNKIKNNVFEAVKRTMVSIFNDLRNSKDFYLEEIFLGKIIEYGFAGFLKNRLGEFEILKKILSTENFDKGILFDNNSILLPFFKVLNKKNRNLELFNDSILKKVKNLSFWFFTKYVLNLLGLSIKTFFQKKTRLKNSLLKKSLNILFICNTKNQFEGIRYIYEFYRNEKNCEAILYKDEYTIPLKEITNLLRFSFKIRNIWLNPNNILTKLSFDSIKLRGILEEYYKFEMVFSLIRVFNNLTNFKKILNSYSPKLVILTDDLKAEARLYTNYCRKTKVSTLLVPHAGIPDYKDLTEKNDFNYIAVPGDLDKKYLTGKGVQSENIFITGRSRYDKFYNREIKQVNEVKDYFNGRIYKFDPHKFTILYATSKVSNESSKEFDIGVLFSLMDLNLLENLVIKIHPAEWGNRYKRVLDELKIKGPVIVKDYDILELMKSSDLYLSRNSYSVLEAMIIGIPVIVLDYVNVDFYFSGFYKFLEERDLITVRNQKSLTESIKKLINEKDFYDNYSTKLYQIAKGYSYNDGKKTATENIVSLIKKIIKTE